METVSPIDSVQLNVGGVFYTVARETLMKFPNTMLSKLVSNRWNTASEGHQEPIFVDRDGERFKYILDWYRDGCIIIPRTVPVAAIENDMSFYGLPDEAILQQEKPSIGECIIGWNDAILLHEKRGEDNKQEGLALEAQIIQNSSERFAISAGSKKDLLFLCSL
jgi:hypothetical protein